MPNKPVDIVLGILVAVGVLSFVVIPLVMGDAKGEAILLVYALWIGVPILFIGVPLGVLVRRMAGRQLEAAGRQLEALLNRGDHLAAKELLAKAFQPDRDNFVAVASAPRYQRALSDPRIVPAVVEVVLSNGMGTIGLEVIKHLRGKAEPQLLKALNGDVQRKEAALGYLAELEWEPTSDEERELVSRARAVVEAEREKQRAAEREKQRAAERAKASGSAPICTIIFKAGDKPANEREYVRKVLASVKVTHCPQVDIVYVNQENLESEFFLLGHLSKRGFDTTKVSVTPFRDGFGHAGKVVKVFA